jgi:O-antigen/teichoic acid export membrane protein
MPAMLGSLISAASDRLVIAEYVNMETVALYSFAFQIASLVYVAGDAITRTMTPLAMSGLVNNKEETKIKIADFSVIIWSVMILVNLIIFLFSKEIVKIMGSDAYEQAYILIPFLGFVYVLGMQQRFPNQIIQFYKKSWIISAGCIIMGGANLLLNLIFVPHWGFVAAVVNTILSNAIYVLWTFIQASRLEKINYKWRKLLLISIVFIVLLFLEYIIVSSMEVTILNFFLKTTIAFAVCCLVILSTDIHIFNKILNYIRK